MKLTSVNQAQVTDLIPANSKWCFTTRRVDHADIAGTDQDFGSMQSGDLLLVQIEKVGNHKRVQLTSGRPSDIYVGDYCILACAARYAPDQFEGIAEIGAESCDLLAGGGVAGKMRLANQLTTAPTKLRPVGRLLDAASKPVNVQNYALPSHKTKANIPVLLVTGASMNAGKTTMTTALAYGLRQAGFNVAGIKATGTGAFGDYNCMSDAGLHYVADFTDAGLASTYLQSIERIENAFLDLISDAERSGCEVAVVELADGIYQAETAAILEHSSIFRDAAVGYFFACGDAVSAVGGIRHLREIGIEPAAISGKISLSPMASEEASRVSGLDVVTREQLMNGEFAGNLLANLVGVTAETYRSAA